MIKHVSGVAAMTFSGVAMAGVVTPLGTPLGVSLGQVLGFSLGQSLPLAGGGVLLVAAAGLGFGIALVRRKRHGGAR